MDNFAQLHQTEHMFKWLSDTPYDAIRSQVESILCEQVSDSVLHSFSVVSEPQWLTGARQPADGGSHAILVRAGVAFEFELVVSSGDQSYQLTGVFTWVGFHLDDPDHQRQQFWFDIDGDLATFGADGALAPRIYNT